MGFKTITIKESVYDKIVTAKRKGESFSDFFDRIVRRKPDIWKYYGAWKLKKGEKEKIMGRIRAGRDRLDMEWKERVKRYQDI